MLENDVWWINAKHATWYYWGMTRGKDKKQNRKIKIKIEEEQINENSWQQNSKWRTSTAKVPKSETCDDH